MPYCLRCKRKVDSNMEDTTGWLSLRYISSINCVSLGPHRFTSRDVPGVSYGSQSLFHPPDAYYWVGLCPECQLSDKQIDNIRRE